MLVANESVASIPSFLELDVFDFSELLEKILKLLFWPLIWKVLHVEIASLFGSLVSERVSCLFDFSLRLFHGMSYVKFHVLSNISPRKILDSFDGAFRSILFVHALRVLVAYKSELTNVVAH